MFFKRKLKDIKVSYIDEGNNKQNVITKMSDADIKYAFKYNYLSIDNLIIPINRIIKMVVISET